MKQKEAIVVISICILIVCALTFWAGTLYTAAKNAQLQYQIKIKVSYSPKVQDSIIVKDGSRYVGTVPLTYGEPFAELILTDNE